MELQSARTARENVHVRVTFPEISVFTNFTCEKRAKLGTSLRFFATGFKFTVTSGKRQYHELLRPPAKNDSGSRITSKSQYKMRKFKMRTSCGPYPDVRANNKKTPIWESCIPAFYGDEWRMVYGIVIPALLVDQNIQSVYLFTISISIHLYIYSIHIYIYLDVISRQHHGIKTSQDLPIASPPFSALPTEPSSCAMLGFQVTPSTCADAVKGRYRKEWEDGDVMVIFNGFLMVT